MVGGACLASAAGDIKLGPDDGQTMVVTLVGDIDMGIATELRLVLEGIETPTVVIDMRPTTFIDSLTIGLLVVAARQEGRVLTIRGLTGAPLRALQQAGVADLLDLQD